VPRKHISAFQRYSTAHSRLEHHQRKTLNRRVMLCVGIALAVFMLALTIGKTP